MAGNPRDLLNESEPHAVVLVYLLEQRADRAAEGLLERRLVGRHDRHLQTASLQAGGRFHADEARADEDRALRPVSGGDYRIRIREAEARQDGVQIVSAD